MCIMWLQKVYGKQNLGNLLRFMPSWLRRIYVLSWWYVTINLVVLVAVFFLGTFVPGLAIFLVPSLALGIVTFFLMAAYAMSFAVFLKTLFEIRKLSRSRHENLHQ